ncbi:MAG: thioredoxin domain-containing protein [Actinomycetaceae bacterium]|nr:thioredoxin domain-containing protein [Actinomycetaceae bacterium]
MTSTDFSETNALPQEQAPATEEHATQTKSTGIIVTAVSVLLIAAIIFFVVLLVKNVDTNGSSSEPTENSSTTSTPDPNATLLTAPERAKEGISLGKELVAGTQNEGATQVDIYFDYSCSHCNHLGNDYGADLAAAAKDGDITLVYHPVAILNTFFSYEGAGAELFVAENEPDKYLIFHELLHEKVMTPYINGEAESPNAQTIVDTAREAGVSDANCEALLKELTDMEDILGQNDQSNLTPLLTKVVETSNRFTTESIAMTGGAGTPTVYIDGVQKENWSTDLANILSK